MNLLPLVIDLISGAGGGIGGAILMLIVGLIKNATKGSAAH